VPSIPVTLEAEIRRIVLQGQPWQKSYEDPLAQQRSWVQWQVAIIPATIGRRIWVPDGPGTKNKTLYEKYIKQKGL
jgi:hypothetical protein